MFQLLFSNVPILNQAQGFPQHGNDLRIVCPVLKCRVLCKGSQNEPECRVLEEWRNVPLHSWVGFEYLTANTNVDGAASMMSYKVVVVVYQSYLVPELQSLMILL